MKVTFLSYMFGCCWWLKKVWQFWECNLVSGTCHFMWVFLWQNENLSAPAHPYPYILIYLEKEPSKKRGRSLVSEFWLNLWTSQTHRFLKIQGAFKIFWYELLKLVFLVTLHTICVTPNLYLYNTIPLNSVSSSRKKCWMLWFSSSCLGGSFGCSL